MQLNEYGDAAPRLDAFQSGLAAQPNSDLVVREFILHGSCFAITEQMTFDLKRQVATEFGIDMSTDVFVVGSAKLGFSIAPPKRFRHFGDTSDIDLAIVSHELYQRIWHEMHEYKESGADWPKRRDFERYLAWGWIRPDKLPVAPTFELANQWWEFFRGLQAQRTAGPFKVAAALYHDMNFLTRYLRQAVDSCRTSPDDPGPDANVRDEQATATSTDGDTRQDSRT